MTAPFTCPPTSQFRIRPVSLSAEELRSLLTPDPERAAGSIMTAASRGMTSAQIVWGQMLLDGHGVSPDPLLAFSWFRQAADSGDVEAVNMLGRCYEHGWGVDADADRAADCYEIAAVAGHAWAQVNLAQILMRKGWPELYPRCYRLFESAAAKGNLKAINSLARFLEEGWAGYRDLQRAADLYRRAAKAGDHWAQYNLATLHFQNGEIGEAEAWLSKAVAVADDGFRRRIAPVLLSQPQPALRRIGLDAIERCARSGGADDLFAYALALEGGIAGPHEPSKALRAFRLAAAQGHPEAVLRLARRRRRLFGTALAGVIRSFIKSIAVPKGRVASELKKMGSI